MAKPGRKSSYTDAIADEICARLASGESLRKICESQGMPDRATVLRWLQANSDFAAKCTRARELQADTFVDKQADVAQGVLDGEIDPHAGKVALSAYQWLAMKQAPKKYSDRYELAGDKDAPLLPPCIRVELVKKGDE